MFDFEKPLRDDIFLAAKLLDKCHNDLRYVTHLRRLVGIVRKAYADVFMQSTFSGDVLKHVGPRPDIGADS